MDFISGVVVAIVSVAFVAIMYKALKDPIDLMLSGLRSAYYYVLDEASAAPGTVEVIRYE